jgi:hypothetical protein
MRISDGLGGASPGDPGTHTPFDRLWVLSLSERPALELSFSQRGFWMRPRSMVKNVLAQLTESRGRNENSL